MTPEPARKLIVRRGMTAHWGCDPSTLRVAVACSEPSGPVARVQTHSFPRTEGLARLGEIHEATVEFTEDLKALWPAPGFVLIEQPSGQNPNLELVYAVGVIVAAMQSVLEGVRFESITSSAWKKLATGYGRQSKMDPETGKPWRDRERYGVLRWARQNGYVGHSWDEADALGIAEAARRLVTLEER